MSTVLKISGLYLRLLWAKLTGNKFNALKLWKDITLLDFTNMDAAIASVVAKTQADKEALAKAQADLAAAQASLDQRTAALVTAAA